MSTKRSSIGALVVCVLCLAVSANASTVVGSWELAGPSSMAGYTLYDYVVKNNASSAIGSMTLHIGVSGASMLDGGTDYSSADLSAESYFRFGSTELTAPGGLIAKTSAGAGLADSLMGILDFTNPAGSFPAGGLVPVARVALPDGTVPADLTISGIAAGQASGNPMYSLGSDIAETALIQAIAGDANRDGLFNTTDIGMIVATGKYRTGLSATWQEGDMNQDGLFNSTDIALMVQNLSYYRTGPYAYENLAPPAPHMPEPLTLATLGLAGLGLAGKVRRRLRLA